MAASRERPPDVVLLDLALPGSIGGLDAIETFAAQTPVVAVTANLDEEVGRETLRRGAFDYVSKPFILAHLADIVATAIGRSGE